MRGRIRQSTSRLFLGALGVGANQTGRPDGRLRVGAIAAATVLFLVAAIAAGLWPGHHGVAQGPRRPVAAAAPSPPPTPAPTDTPSPAATPSPPPATPAPTPTPPPPATPAPPPAPAPPAAPAAAVRQAFTASSGPNCGTSSAADLSFFTAGDNGTWHATTGGAPGFSCDSPRYSAQSGSATSWKNDADWVFTPGTGVSACTFSIWVATGTWSSSVLYNVYSGDTTNGFQGSAFASFHLDQHSLDPGGWATEGPFSFSSGTIDLSITDAGTDPHFGAVADVVKASCS